MMCTMEDRSLGFTKEVALAATTTKIIYVIMGLIRISQIRASSKYIMLIFVLCFAEFNTATSWP